MANHQNTNKSSLSIHIIHVQSRILQTLAIIIYLPNIYMRSLLLLSPLRLPIPNPVFNFFNSNSIFRFYSRPSHYLRSAITPPTMTSPIEESVGVARRCWINFKKESTFALYTPFVVCLASGTLNIDTFRHYIAQDVHFLKAFVQGSVLSLSFFSFLIRLINLSRKCFSICSILFWYYNFSLVL